MLPIAQICNGILVLYTNTTKHVFMSNVGSKIASIGILHLLITKTKVTPICDIKMFVCVFLFVVCLIERVLDDTIMVVNSTNQRFWSHQYQPL